MVKFRRLLAAGLLVIICFSFYGSVFAAESTDVDRIFSKIKADPDFMPALYAVIPKYIDKGITETVLDNRIKKFIGSVIDKALEEKANGKLTKENYKTQLQNITIQSAASMEPVYISLILDAFPNSSDMLMDIVQNKIPSQFDLLYQEILKETEYILGFEVRPYDLVFSDMDSYLWAEEAVYTLYNLKVINGVSDGLFAPGENVTREQFVKMLVLLFDIKGITERTVTFTDVPEDSWYYPYVTAAASAKVVNGISETAFGTGQEITRQDMAVMIYNVCNIKGYITNTDSNYTFADNADIATYARNAVIALKENGIVSGTPENNFNPNSFATRAEAAQILFNCSKKFNK